MLRKTHLKTIGVFTPHVDTFTNPFLIRFFERLESRGIHVLLFSPSDKIPVPSHLHNVKLINVPMTGKRALYTALRSPRSFWSALLVLLRTRTDAVVGIDPKGFVRAARINRFWKGKLGYFSFEILSLQDSMSRKSRRLKEIELRSTPCADFVVIQDKRRLEMLRQENAFVEGCRFFLIPVSPRSVNLKVEKDHLRKEIGISAGKTLLIHSGSLGTWSGVDQLLDAVESHWNNEHWLVIHSRTRVSRDNPYRRRIEKLALSGRSISLHDMPFEDPIDYYRYLAAFDIGLALYASNDFEGEYAGKNIEEIGLSSGKFNTYMMLGVPAIVKDHSMFPDLNEEYNFGAIVETATQLSSAVNEIMKNYESKRTGSLRLYNEVLRADEGMESLIDWIEQLERGSAQGPHRTFQVDQPIVAQRGTNEAA